jgi:hypothetical protein
MMVNLDVRTRWNSAYDMVAKFIKLKGAIQHFCQWKTGVSQEKTPGSGGRRVGFVIWHLHYFETIQKCYGKSEW